MRGALGTGQGVRTARRWWRRLRRAALALTMLVAAHATTVLAQQPAPTAGFGDLVEPDRAGRGQHLHAQRRCHRGGAQMRRRPRNSRPGSPFEEFFKEFFDQDKQQQEQQPRRSFSLGSGFVVDAAGFVVTNNHVIADADEITVIFSDDSEYPAKLIGTRHQDRSGAAQDRGRQAVPVRGVGGQRPGPGRRLDDRDRQPVRPRLAPSPPASSRRAVATSGPGPTTISSRSTRRSTAATPAARASPSTARCSASTPRSSRPRAAMSASASPSRPTSPSR